MFDDLNRILIISEGQLGDLLLLTPTIKAIKKSKPYAQIDLFIIARNRSMVNENSNGVLNEIIVKDNDFIFSGNPYINNVYIVKHYVLRESSFFKKLSLEFFIINYLRSHKYQIIINAFPHDRFVLWSYLSGAKIRIGEMKNILSNLLTDKLEIKKEMEGVLRYYTHLVEPLQIEVKSLQTEFFISSEADKWAENYFNKHHLSKNDNIVAIHPGASGNYKIWPPGYYAKLIDKLSEVGTKIILCYGDFDNLVIEEILSTSKTKPLLLNTGSDLNRLACIFKHSDLCITNDSGPRHLAISVGAKSLALFRKHHTKAWKIYDENSKISILISASKCPVCPENDCRDLIPEEKVYGSYCIREISVDRVFLKVVDMIKIS